MKPGWHRQSGFTLIELLSVIAILSVLMGVLSYGILSGAGRSLDGAVRLAGSQFAQARNLSIRDGVRVRVLVHNDSSDPERYLRAMNIIQHQPIAGSSGRWVARERESLLPDGYYFIPTMAGAEGSGEPDTMEWAPPDLASGGEFRRYKYYYFEYSPRGDAVGEGMQFWIEPGNLQQIGNKYSVVSQYKQSGDRNHVIRGGFRILRWGGLLYYPDTTMTEN